MRIRIESILKILLILFLTMNVLLIDIKVLGINLRYAVFFSACFISIFFFSKGKFLDQKTVRSLVAIIICAILLFSYSVLLRGNNYQNALWFILPYSTFLSIPLFRALFRYYSVKRCIDFFIYTTCLLSVYYVILLLLFFFQPTIAFRIVEVHSLAMLVVDNDVPRVFFKTSTFFIPVFVYCLLYIESACLKFFCSIIVIIQIACFLTFGLFFGVFVVVFLYLIYKKKYLLLLVILCLVCFSALAIVNDLENFFSASKLYSIGTKVDQISKGFDTDSVISFLFGDGIGAPIIGLDERNLTDNFIIEVAPVMIYKVGGVFGAIMIVYIYSWYAVKGFFRSLIFKDRDIAFFALSQIGMLFASISNPLIWSGGTGILFISMLIVAYNQNKIEVD